MLHTNTKAPCLPVSERKNFEVRLLCSFFPPCDPAGRGQFWPQGHHMNKLGRGPTRDATYQISKLYIFKFQRKRIVMFAVFVSMFQLVTPRAGSVLTPGASHEQIWSRSTRRCCIQNIKALGLPLSEKKKFWNLSSLFLWCNLWTQGLDQSWP